MKNLFIAVILILGGVVCAPVSAAETLTLTLTWTDTANNEDGFRVYRRAESDPDLALLQELPTPDTEQFVDTVPDGSVRYCYAITAYNGNGESNPSNEACSKTFVELPPNAPTNLVVQKMTITQSQSVVIQPQ